MKRYQFIFNRQTLLIECIALLSSIISLQFRFHLYIDFIFLGIIIAFPLTFTLRESFRRRERAIEYLSTFNASLQSSYFHFESSKQEQDTKEAFKNILMNLSDTLLQYLSGKTKEASEVQRSSDAVFIFLQANKENFKSSFSEKILSFQFRINESIDMLLATKRHHTPSGIRVVIIVAIYAFVIVYPASVLAETGFDVALWHVFGLTGFKALVLICLFNVQRLFEDPFNEDNIDGIRLEDFRCKFIYDTYIGTVSSHENRSLDTNEDTHDEEE